ncbi:zinc finger protein draculin-like isoform X5 [Aricia agestis]|uniref:zinc finger protein draculin-like isoform X5 n=1 Tax=Aricia agestis TaxID=91739 RepID=UPI001C207F24|nr:zinc finger protein draculin-like isoform X5 [Aricia agestis]
MEAAINYGLCRCCASEGSFKDLEKTYDWLGTEEVYANMLKDCFDISLSKQDSFNNGGICEVCITQLRNASNFKKQVQQTEQQFLKKIEDNGYQTSIIKVEVARPDDDDHDLFDDGNLSDGFSSPEYDIPLTKIKVEKLNETKPKKRAAKPSTSKAKKLKKEAGEPSAKRTQRQPKDVAEPKTKQIELVNTMKNNVRIEHRSRIKEIQLHQTNIREILLNTTATPIRSRGGIGYTCCFCSQQYPNPADLKKHTWDAHEQDKMNFMKGKDMHNYFVKLDITDLACRICKSILDSLEEMMNHLKVAHEKEIYSDINNHILPFKFNGESLRCCICLNIFNSFKALQEHMNVHYGNYVCEDCGAGFVNKNILLRHRDAHKTGTFSCDKCFRNFDTARKKRLHDRSYHEKDRLPYKCGHCEERFKGGRQKHEHMLKVHGIRGPKVNCQVCDKSFETKHAWRLHTTRVHLQLKPHLCDLCNKGFYAKTELESHMVKHTESRDFTCDVCFKAYGRLKTLTCHKKKAHTQQVLRT